MEYLDIVDENNNLIGKVVEKDIVHNEGLWHREVAIWVINEEGRILLQKRAATKKLGANKWAICAGHVDTGEDVKTAAERELFEEIGLKCDDLEFLFISKVIDTREGSFKNNMFMYMYFLKTNTKLEDYIIQYEELSELKYIDIKELEQIVENKDSNVTFSEREYIEQIVEEIKKRINR